MTATTPTGLAGYLRDQLTPPLATVDGDAVKTIVGSGEVTTTSADCEADPPSPLQVSV